MIMVVWECNVVKVLKELDLCKFGLLGCGYVIGLGIVFNMFKLELGFMIVVIGIGVVGLVVMMVGWIFGCIIVIVVDIYDEWFELVKEFGVIDVINSKNVDMVKVI